MDMRIRIDGKADVTKRLNLTPSKVQRAARLTVNQATRELKKELGGTIPKNHGTSIAGFRRVRAKSTLAKGRSKRVRGITWVGTKNIAAAYAGKPRNVKNGAKAGRFFFDGGFVVKMKSGHKGIFRRVAGSDKIKEVTIPLTNAEAMVARAAKGARGKIMSIMQKQLRKQMK